MADAQRLGERYWLTPKGEAAVEGQKWDPVKEYKAAQAAMIATRADTRIFKAAKELAEELGDLALVYYYPCTICGVQQEYRTVVREAATLVEWPRGICGRHDPDNGHDAVLVVT